MTGVSRAMVYMSGTRVKRTPLQNFLRRTMGIATIIAIIWTLYSIPYTILREERFRVFGEERTTGLVLAVQTDNTNQNDRFSIKYKYVDPDGFARIITAPLPHAIWQKFRPGNRVVVFYARSKPGLARIPGEIQPPFQIWLHNILH